MGDKGAYFIDNKTEIYQESYKVDVIDTTAAGDTFLAYFLYDYLANYEPAQALKLAAQAAAMTVTRKGAMDTIPKREQLP